MSTPKRDPERDIQPIGFRDWLTSCMCWEIKLGFPLVLLGKALLWWTDWYVPGLRWPWGQVLLWLGIACLVWGLIRDCWLIGCHVTTRRHRTPK